MPPQHPSENAEESAANARRRDRLAGEFFRNAMALAMLKQVLVAGQVGVRFGDEEEAGRSDSAIPGHLEG